jgi:hypothetical protein
MIKSEECSLHAIGEKHVKKGDPRIDKNILTITRCLIEG